MRELHLFADRKAHPKRIVQGLNAANPITELRETQGDTLTIFVHQFDRNPSTPPLTAFVEKPLEASAVRASVGYIDAAPQSGTFKFKVGSELSAELTWPADLSSSALIAAWKTAALAALNAIAGIPSGGARLDDPADTPAHIFYFTWVDEAATAEIEIVSNRLIPWIEATVEASVIPVGFTQMVKLARFPLKMSGAFAQATTPPVTLIETRPGSTGVNAEQTIVIPAAAAGSFALTWAGAKTKTMDVTTVTAASLAAALNAIVSDGSTNPSFRVEARVQREGKRFAVEFIGPLAGAAQDEFGVTMYDQQGAPYWTGSLVLDGLGLEMALNGGEEADLTFELVISSGGEETYLLPLVLENDMTAPETPVSAEEVGAIQVVEHTVLVDSGDLEPYVEASPGFSYSPASAAAAFAITHNLNTRQPAVRVSYKESASPEKWRDLSINAEFDAKSDGVNTVTVTFPESLSADTGSALYFGLYKIFVASPDAQIVIYSHGHAWSEILETLPGGLSLADKLAAIDAALGIVGGSLRINASQIDGLLKAEQIDLAAVSTALKSVAEFLATLRELVKDSTLVENLAEQLGLSEKFVESLITILDQTGTEDQPSFLETLTTKLLENSTFNAELNSMLLAALAGGNALPDGVTVIEVPDFTVDLAPPYTLATIGGKPLMGFPELPIELPAASAGSALDGELSSTIVATVHAVTAVAISPDFGARRGRRFLSTDKDPLGNALKIANPRGYWYQVTNFGSGTNWWPAEMELVVMALAISEEIFYAGAQLTVATPFHAKLSGGWQARLDLILEIGYDVAEQTTQLANVTWTALRTWTLRVSEVTAFRKLSIVATRGDDVAATWTRSGTTATITSAEHDLATGAVIAVLVSSAEAAIVLGSKTITVTGDNTFTFACLNAGATSGTLTYGVFALACKTGVLDETLTPPTGPNFRLRLRTSKFGVENPPADTAPLGSLQISRTGTRAGIAPLTA